MTAPHPPTSPDGTPRKTDLNPTHVTAAALAAVTTAVLGSMLGTAGTLIGAAGASVITTVGTALYQASLERSRERVRSLTQRSRLTSREGPRAQSAPPRWGAVVVGALGAFLLAMMAITGFEWASGETVGGNGTGTTIGQVVTNQSGPQKPATPHRPNAPTSETPTGTSPAPDTTTSSSNAPDGGFDVGPSVEPSVEQSPTRTSDRPTPSGEVTTTPPLLPTRLPGVGG
ncbi:MAG TPA: hypothetical protein VK784_17215 [Pseudonocardiaceae bacterium]|jgi:hypothetical protein|nr:hypothetical protein [Pseudonocardiaceae bacterium]